MVTFSLELTISVLQNIASYSVFSGVKLLQKQERKIDLPIITTVIASAVVIVAILGIRFSVSFFDKYFCEH